MNCVLCTKSGPIYDRNCLTCCARLVESARPSRTQQNAMLAFVGRGKHTSDAVLAFVRRRAALELQRPLEKV